MPLQPDERKFTVVTCSLPVMAEALHLPHIELLNLCGDFDRDSESYSGPLTIGRSATSIPPRVPGCIEHQRARLNLPRRVVCRRRHQAGPKSRCPRRWCSWPTRETQTAAGLVAQGSFCAAGEGLTRREIPRRLRAAANSASEHLGEVPMEILFETANLADIEEVTPVYTQQGIRRLPSLTVTL